MYSWPVGCGGGGEDLCSPLSEAGSGVKWGSQAMNVTARAHSQVFYTFNRVLTEVLPPTLNVELPVFSKLSGRLATL